MKIPFGKKKNEYAEKYDEKYDNDFYGEEEKEEEGTVGDFEEPVAENHPEQRTTRSAVSGNMLKVVKPQDFKDGSDIVGYLMDGYTVVMDIEQLDRPSAIRLIDFLLGAITVLDGELRRVTNTTMVVSPHRGSVSDAEDDRKGEAGESEENY